MQKASSSERAQRVRIGLTGLAFVFLLVVIGTAISRSGDSPAEQINANGFANGIEPDEPLAQIGVAPGQSTTENGQGGAPRAQ
jgi:cell division septal protein FtsQ